MLAKLQERWYFLLVLRDAAGIAWVRTRRTLRDMLDILVALVRLLLDTEILRNKFYTILLIACTLPIMFLEGDATATVFVVNGKLTNFSAAILCGEIWPFLLDCLHLWQ